MNSSSIIEKEIKENNKGKNLFSASFIFYLNKNRKFIDDLFNSINKSNESIIYDKNKNINYLPFWLYILRNISSLNCIEYNVNDNIDEEIAKHIGDKIKEKISYHLKNKKPLNLKWINLINYKISPEISDQKIYFIFFSIH